MSMFTDDYSATKPFRWRSLLPARWRGLARAEQAAQITNLQAAVARLDSFVVETRDMTALVLGKLNAASPPVGPPRFRDLAGPDWPEIERARRNTNGNPSVHIPVASVKRVKVTRKPAKRKRARRGKR